MTHGSDIRNRMVPHPSMFTGKSQGAMRHPGPAPRWPCTRRPRDNAGMDIVLNGEPRTLDHPGTTIAALLAAEGLAERRVAVEVTGEIVPRGRHAAHDLKPGDRIEIVYALGGG
jgi:sulfur carrier protein